MSNQFSRAVRDTLADEAHYRELAEDDALDSWLSTMFAKAPASMLVTMWETGKHHSTGKRLTSWERTALAMQWRRRFGEKMPSTPSIASDARPILASEANAHDDDTMIDKHEVLRLTGISESTLKRWVKRGVFPSPIEIGAHINRWLARDVKQWISDRTKPRL